MTDGAGDNPRTVWRWIDALTALVLVAVLPSLVLLFGLRQASSVEEQRLAAASTRVVNALERRIQIYEQVLHGARGLIAASQDVSPEEWRSYASSATLGPIAASRGLGWAVRTSRAGIPALQASGTVPGGNRASSPPIATGDACLVVAHAYPDQLASNLGWSCLDDDPAAAEAISRAGATGTAVLSGPMSATGEVATVLLIMPIYNGFRVPATDEARQASLHGVVFTPLDVNELAGDLLVFARDVAGIDIFDGPPTPGRLISSRSITSTPSAESRDLPMLIGGRTWTMRVRPMLANDGAVPTFPWLLASATMGLGALVMLLILQARGRQDRARILAERMTADLRLAQAELRTALRAAQEAAHTKDGFLAVMSHELRTPLNGVIGMTNLLLDSPLSEQQRDFAETGRNCATGLLEVINDILDYSRLEAGRTPIEEIPFDPRDLLEDVLQVVADRALGKGLELAGEVDPRLGQRLRSDPSRLRQLLLNLIANAIKFTEHGEVVATMRLARDDDSRPMVRITVRDTGIGISAEQQAQLFQPFTQADGSISRRFGGTGLGLAICKRLTELMGGTISLSSEPGHGSEFTIMLPMGRDQPSDASSPPTELAGRLALVIDDHPVARSAVTAILGDYGCEVVASIDADAGIRRFEGIAPDLAVIDASDIDGDRAALVARLRATPGWGGVPVVLLVRFGAQAQIAIERCAQVSKPVRRRQLRDAAIALLGGRPGSGTARIPRRFPGVHVLVADGRLGNLRIMAGILAELGCHAELATDLPETIAAAARAPDAVVLVAADLPPTGAETAAARLRTMGHRGPIYACGGIDQVVPPGCSGWIHSPPRGSDLARLLARLGGAKP